MKIQKKIENHGGIAKTSVVSMDVLTHADVDSTQADGVFQVSFSVSAQNEAGDKKTFILNYQDGDQQDYLMGHNAADSEDQSDELYSFVGDEFGEAWQQVQRLDQELAGLASEVRDSYEPATGEYATVEIKPKKKEKSMSM